MKLEEETVLNSFSGPSIIRLIKCLQEIEEIFDIVKITRPFTGFFLLFIR